MSELALPEEWRSVVGYEGRYSVSDHGRVRRETSYHYWKAGELLTPNIGPFGYHRYLLSKNRVAKRHQLARMILEAFVGPAPDGWQAAHLNGNPQDNRLCNLKWCTPKENDSHKWEHGTQPWGEQSHYTKLSRQQVDEIRNLLASSGMNQSQIARRFKVTTMTIHNIRTGKTWCPRHSSRL